MSKQTRNMAELGVKNGTRFDPELTHPWQSLAGLL
jgi:hypothetical protein